MLKLFLGKIIPLGLTGLFLKSSFSPIKPALAAFQAANVALSGGTVENSGADLEGMAKDALANKGGFASKGSSKESAKNQLNDIINEVKARSLTDSAGTESPRSGKGGKGKGKGGKGKSGSKTAKAEARPDAKANSRGDAPADDDAPPTVE